ncbi:hypothetical protein ONZ45_g1960 [Pleurotus djamor]|nr:hypothetical protein ONZ45_g1960 [Pleurotus djamor]
MSTSAKTKALLIGIGDDGSGNPLLGPRKDAIRMKKLLMKTYGYKKDDIVLMHDKHRVQRLQPTKGNILREIDNLVKDCQPGDRFVFHCEFSYARVVFYGFSVLYFFPDSGHTGQQENYDGTEVDGQDERMEVMGGEYILDDELRDRLVDPLCPGSQLIAILDSCHSATLLDLPHVECHETLSYHPSLMDHSDFSPTKLHKPKIGLGAFRSRARLPSFRKPKPKLTLQFPKNTSTGFQSTGPVTSILPPDTTFSFSPVSANVTSLEVTHTALDKRKSLPLGNNVTVTDKGAFYLGPCHACPILPEDKVKRSNAELPMVLAISACTDAQFSYEDSKGNGMTKMLCKFLKQSPNPTLNRLHTGISFGLFRPGWDRVHSQAWIDFIATLKEQGATDGANFYQHPSLSSLQRLNPNYKLHL